MKTFGFITSVIAFFVSLFFAIIDFPDLSNSNGIIYLSIQFILILICITGIIINMPSLSGIFKKNKKNNKYNMHI
ncbi:hypothetical protein [Flavobacterium sp. NRK1]|uniref:hypothetical protein n=1 Tax=Flavobacterium sp. NRK1 TaxID=2954929 RepID=UPI002092FC62|nr:hypothetical protein [Flavobacterium sp. NRK1]MCO6149255.1 hypothetical protein [Flavobacterium sp. NRK1]